MRFFSTFHAAKQALPDPGMMKKMGELIAEFTQSGVLVSTGGLLPVSMGGARVKKSGPEFGVVDGPFSEAKEVVVGYAILETKTREAAIEVSRRFMEIAGDGECELRVMATEPQQGC